MNRKKPVIVVLAIVGVLWATASFAQQRERQPGDSPRAPLSRPDAPQAITPEARPVPKASLFMGSSVVNPQGEKLGKIEDLVIDPATGRITYAALSQGSILGIGGKLYAVSWEALKLQPDGKTFVLNVSKQALENAPDFDKSNWPKQPDPILRAAASGTGAASGIGAAPGTAAAPGTGKMARPSVETASGPGVSATVQNVNTQKATVTLKTEQGENMELQAPAAMLGGLQAGDAVEVKMVGTWATDIRKKE